MAKKKKSSTAVLRLMNIGKQTIPLEVKPEGGDFYRDRSNVYLHPKKVVDLPKSYLNMKQIENLQKKRHLKIVRDEEKVEKEKAAQLAEKEAREALQAEQ
jgi:hypothetical protein